MDGVAVVCLHTVVIEGGKRGGSRGPLGGLCLCCPWRRDAVHEVRVEGGGGGDGGGSGGDGVGGRSFCRLGDGFWWREGQEARNG